MTSYTLRVAWAQPRSLPRARPTSNKPVFPCPRAPLALPPTTLDDSSSWVPPLCVPSLKGCPLSPIQATAQLVQAQPKWGKMEDVYDSLALRLLRMALATPAGTKCLVALAGPPGAGKSTVAAEAVRRVNDAQWRRQAMEEVQVEQGQGRDSVWQQGEKEGPTPGVAEWESAESSSRLAEAIPMDGFHLYRWQLDCMPDPGAAHSRRGAPWTFDPDALYRHLKRIKDRGVGCLPSFDHAVGDPVERDIYVESNVRVVLVEGNYLLLQEGAWAPLRSLFHETWFLDVDVDEAMRRVEDRHVGTGNTRELARQRVSLNDRPNALLVLATKRCADLVVPSLPLQG